MSELISLFVAACVGAACITAAVYIVVRAAGCLITSCVLVLVFFYASGWL